MSDFVSGISEYFMVCWSNKKLCFLLLLSDYFGMYHTLDISRGCIQVSPSNKGIFFLQPHKKEL